jgi:DNA-binding helix-hairpin-helix protein with protein kinase domain
VAEVWTERGEPVELGERIGIGGGGLVRAVAGRDDLAAKIYRSQGSRMEPRTTHIGRMLALDPEIAAGPLAGRLAWPVHGLYGAAQEIRGFVMPRIHGASQLGEVVDAAGRRGAGVATTWRWPLRAAIHLAYTVALVHQFDLVVGDLSDANVLIQRTSARATLVDCDAMTLPGETDTGIAVVTPDIAPRELLDGGGQVTRESDSWQLAVLVCQLLMEGEHPFLGTPAAADRDRRVPADNVRDGVSRFRSESSVELPARALPLSVLPSSVRALAERCFGDGLADPMSRPAPSEWVRALVEADNTLRACEAVWSHRFAASLERCPWCERATSGLPDPFAAAESTAA